MSNRTYAFAFLLAFAIYLSACTKDSGPPTDEEILGNLVVPEVIDEYNYPVRPGSPEWAKLSSHDEMLAAVELPGAVLQSITTWGLVKTCFDYPLSGDASAHNNQVAYIDDLAQSFNGLKELFARDDVSGILLYNYRHLDFSLYPGFPDRHYIELLMGCNAFVSKLDKRQLQYLASVALEKADFQNEHFESSMPPYSYFVMANAMIHYGYEPFIKICSGTPDYSNTGYFLWRINASVEQIKRFAKEFVNG